MVGHDDLETALLDYRAPARRGTSTTTATASRRNWVLPAILALLFAGLVLLFLLGGGGGREWERGLRVGATGGDGGESIEAEHGVVAADDGRCSEIGAATLRKGGHAVDAAVATALCLGVVNPMSSGIGGGAFMVVWSSAGAGAGSRAEAFDSRETAPLAASQELWAWKQFCNKCPLSINFMHISVHFGAPVSTRGESGQSGAPADCRHQDEASRRSPNLNQPIWAPSGARIA